MGSFKKSATNLLRGTLCSSSWDTKRQSQSDCKAVCTSNGASRGESGVVWGMVGPPPSNLEALYRVCKPYCCVDEFIPIVSKPSKLSPPAHIRKFRYFIFRATFVDVSGTPHICLLSKFRVSKGVDIQVVRYQAMLNSGAPTIEVYISGRLSSANRTMMFA